MRLLVAAAAFLLLAECAGAQIVYVVFRDRDIEKRYAKYLRRVNGVDALVGEPKAGVTLKDGVVNYISGDNAANELWVSDPAAPDKPPYEHDPKTWDKVRSKKGKGGVVAFSGNEIAGIKLLDRLMTLESYAQEYLHRMGDVEALAKELKELKRGEREWFQVHGRMVARYVRLESWLRNAGFEAAADALVKLVEKERKVTSKEAATIREAEALKSVKQLDTPAKLAQAAKDISGGRVEFHVCESRHMRVTYVTALQDERVRLALELVERVTEGFRRECIDPYIDDDFTDQVPADGPLVEFWFGPQELAEHERYLTEYYGVQWGKQKQQEMQASGALFYRDSAPYYLHYRKWYDDVDLEGYLAHGIGWALADLHYNRGRRNDAQPWIMEALGYDMALGYLGRNNMTTFSEGEKRYAESAREPGKKTAKMGLRGYYNETALKQGAPIDTIGAKQLYQLTDEDYAKAWSVFDYVAHRLGRDGQVWLRATCDAAGDPAGFSVAWRKATEALHPVAAGVDAFAELEKGWRRYAEREQVAEIE